MGYVEQNLLPGEEVLYEGKVHWQVFIPAIVNGIAALGTLLLSGESGCVAGAPLFIVLFLVFGLKAYIIWTATEIAVTNKRVIGKVGLIRRNSLEIVHSKVESLGVDQSILGRIFNYGTVIISGTGGNRLPVKMISCPLQFRNQASEAGDSA